MSVNWNLKTWRTYWLVRIFVVLAGIGVLFAFYSANADINPPGFYVDESAISYNAYLVAQTGAGESGVKFPLFFPVYTEVFTQYANPTQIYLLAAVFKIFGPSILAARLTASASVFFACILLGLLARRVTKNRSAGAIVFGLALTAPWLFEIGRVVLETFLYPAIVTTLLWSIFRVSKKSSWSYLDSILIAAALALTTYSYTIGRALGPLLAGGLILFAIDKTRIVSVIKVWTIYLLTLIPLIVYLNQNPELSLRFKTLTYLRPENSFTESAGEFIYRFTQDLNPLTMLLSGDINPRHHLPGSGGSFLLGTFILALIGIGVIVIRHRRSSWWLYIIFGLLASLVPGALTVDEFHTLRMIGYPVFLLMLTIPALEWLLAADVQGLGSKDAKQVSAGTAANDERDRQDKWHFAKLAACASLLTVTAAQSVFFFFTYQRTGMNRGEYFDAAYQKAYKRAVGMTNRPIYLVDGYWGPAYVHAYWYATLEGRGTDEFVHPAYGEAAPAGSIVLSSERSCTQCLLLSREGEYIVYMPLE